MMMNLMKVREAARCLAISPSMVYSIVQAGKLAHFRVGNAIRISETQIREFLENRQQAAKEEKPPARRVNKPKFT